MSTDPSWVATRRVDAAVEEVSQPVAATVPPQALADLAAAIERVEALITPAATPAPDRSAAVERIADIAFVLHEREVEASLCDALDAAVREISEAGGFQQPSMQNTQQAAELLRDLSRRVNDMIALAQAELRAPPPEPGNAERAAPVAESAPAGKDDGDEAADDDLLESGLFEADLPEDDEFAQVVASITASLPSVADAEEPLSELPLADAGPETALTNEPPAAASPDEPSLPQMSGEAASPPPMVSEDLASADLVAASALTLPAPAGENPQSAPVEVVVADAGLAVPAAPAVPEINSESPDAAPDEQRESALPNPAAAAGLVVEQPAHPDDAEDDAAGHQASELFSDVIEPPAAEQTVTRAVDVGGSAHPPGEQTSSQTLLPESRPSIDPNEDPGDLFEPVAETPVAMPAAPRIAVAGLPSEPAANSVRFGSPEAKGVPVASARDNGAAPPSVSAGFDAKPAMPAQPPAARGAAATPGQAAARPSPNDPLAPVRALSEEEMIALFT